MSANVETMAYYGAVPWHGLGKEVEHLMTSEEALREAQLDWAIEQKQLFLEDGTEVPNMLANVRDRDNKIMGLVTPRYKVVQNTEAFEFTDELIGNGDAHYETAGSLDGGKRVWMMLRLPGFKILDDDIDNYLVVTNTHTGLGSLRAALTPTRVVCQNTLNWALDAASRTWSVRHTGAIEAKLEEAQRALELSEHYTAALQTRAAEMAIKHIDKQDMQRFIEILYPIDPEASPAILARMEAGREAFYTALDAPDLANIKMTAWGVYNAVADVESHKGATRSSATFQQSKFKSFIDGNRTLMHAQELLEALVA